jgi:hypothetical protein
VIVDLREELLHCYLIHMNIVRKQNKMFRYKVLTFKIYVTCKLKLCEYDLNLIITFPLNTPETLTCETQIIITNNYINNFSTWLSTCMSIIFLLIKSSFECAECFNLFLLNHLTKLANLTIVKYKPHIKVFASTIVLKVVSLDHMSK